MMPPVNRPNRGVGRRLLVEAPEKFSASVTLEERIVRL